MPNQSTDAREVDACEVDACEDAIFSSFPSSLSSFWRIFYFLTVVNFTLVLVSYLLNWEGLYVNVDLLATSVYVLLASVFIVPFPVVYVNMKRWGNEKWFTCKWQNVHNLVIIHSLFHVLPVLMMCQLYIGTYGSDTTDTTRTKVLLSILNGFLLVMIHSSYVDYDYRYFANTKGYNKEGTRKSDGEEAITVMGEPIHIFWKGLALFSVGAVISWCVRLRGAPPFL